MSATSATPDSAAEAAETRRAAGARLRRYARAHLRAFVLGTLALVGTHACTQAIPWMLKLAIDALGRATGEGRAAGPAAVQAALQTAGRFVAAIAVLAVVGALMRIASRLLIFNAGRTVEYQLRQDLLAHLVRLAPSFYRRNPTGDIMSRLTNDVAMVRALVGFGVLTAANVALAYLLSVPLLLSLNWRLGLWALLPYLLMAAGIGRLTRRMFVISGAVQKRLGELSSALQEDLAGALLVRAYHIADKTDWRFAELGDRYLEENLELVKLRGLMLPLIGLSGGVATVLVLYLGGRSVGGGKMTPGDFVAFVAYLGQLAWPTVSLGWLLSLTERGRAAALRLEALFAEPVTIDNPRLAGPPPPVDEPVRGRLDVRGLSLSLEGRRVLDDVHLEIPAGSQVAIVGRTGSGKSLLVEALMRLWEVPPGTVFLDGRDVTEWPLERLRRAFGYAPQEAFLFSATLEENICFALPEPDREAALFATRRAGLARDLAELPDGLLTLVGERGITLSGGQRQRAALARALIAEAPVLLLDDSLSSVDAQTERQILGELAGARKGRTTLLISHRVAAVRDADQIVVLDEGRVVERGRHEELVALGGLYASLYERQLLADQLGEATAAAPPRSSAGGASPS